MSEGREDANGGEGGTEERLSEVSVTKLYRAT